MSIYWIGTAIIVSLLLNISSLHSGCANTDTQVTLQILTCALQCLAKASTSFQLKRVILKKYGGFMFHLLIFKLRDCFLNERIIRLTFQMIHIQSYEQIKLIWLHLYYADFTGQISNYLIFYIRVQLKKYFTIKNNSVSNKCAYISYVMVFDVWLWARLQCIM